MRLGLGLIIEFRVEFGVRDKFRISEVLGIKLELRSRFWIRASGLLLCMG